MDALSILQELIAIPSVNPMGRDLSGPEFLETRLSDYLVEFFERRGVEDQRIEVAPNRANVVARYQAPLSQTTILMDAHQDTVPTDGMVIDPFDASVKDGRIFGRGACDVKGGMAAMLAAFERLVRERPAGSANVVMSCTCDEEATVLGICDLVRLWSDPALKELDYRKRSDWRDPLTKTRRYPDTPPVAARHGTLLSNPPEVALVAEPTDLNIVVAHRGATRWKIQTTGRACHSSDPSEGINAIYRMARVIDCLQEYAARLPQLVPPHPLCGPATLSVGRIEGGISVNTVPDLCAIEVDRRVIPGEDGNAVIRQMADFLSSRLDFEVNMLPPWLIGTPLSDENNGVWADRLMAHIEAIVGERNKIGVPYGTHASRIADAGVPSIVFGPGSVAQAHTKDEWLSIEELEQASKVYYQFCVSPG